MQTENSNRNLSKKCKLKTVTETCQKYIVLCKLKTAIETCVKNKLCCAN